MLLGPVGRLATPGLEAGAATPNLRFVNGSRTVLPRYRSPVDEFVPVPLPMPDGPPEIVFLGSAVPPFVGNGLAGSVRSKLNLLVVAAPPCLPFGS